MIPFDFAYHRPTSLEEAVRTHQACSAAELRPAYFSGGTEIITLWRTNDFYTEAVVDLKSIPECNVLQWAGNQLAIGACLSLNQIAEANVFPLLGDTVRRIADHTSRNKITLGGNLCAQIPYREAVLPLLLTDTQLVLAGPGGLRIVPIHQVFAGHLRLEESELLVQIRTFRRDTSLPHVHFKKTKIEDIDYPLLTLAALKKDNRVRVALSGVCAFPFRSLQMEEVLNNPSLPWELRVEQALQALPAPILHDIRGSADYRRFVLRNTLTDAFAMLEGV